MFYRAYAMTRTFYISAISVLILLFVDFWTLKQGDLQQSVEALENYCLDNFDTYKSELLDSSFILILQSDSISQEELKKIRRIQAKLKSKSIEAVISKPGARLFWTEGNNAKAFCKSYGRADLRLKMCISPFNSNGQLQKYFYQNSPITARLEHFEQATDKTIGWFVYNIASDSKYRSARLNNLLLFFYIILFLVIVAECFKANSYVSFSLLLILRALIFVFPDWHNRFANSDLLSQIFNWQSYTNVDLLLDMFIVFSLLSYISQKLSLIITKKNQKLQLLTHGILLLLLIVSHIRLTRFLALSDNFNVTINDISSINIPETTIFLSLILCLTGIFIYAVSFIQLIKRILSTRNFYIGLLAMIVIQNVLVLSLNPGMPWLYVLLFSACFYILVDLFIDIDQKSITWVIWWAIFFGIYMSSLFFYFDIEKQIESRKIFLSALFSDTPDIDRSQTMVLDSVITHLEELFVLPEEASYDTSDISSHLLKRYPEYKIKFDVLTRKKALFKMWNDRQYLEQKSDSIYLNHVDNYLWKKIAFGDSLDLAAGIQLVQPRNQTYPFIILTKDKIYNYGLNYEPGDLSRMRKSNDPLSEYEGRVYISHGHGDVKAFCVKEFESIVKPIALFSLLFTFIILLFTAIAFASRHYKVLPTEWPINVRQFESLNGRIQTALIIVILLSFIVIAAATSTFLSQVVQDKNNLYLTEKIENLSRDIENKLILADSPGEAIIIAGNYKDDLEINHNTKLDIIDFNKPVSPSNYFAYAYFSKRNMRFSFTENLNDSQYISYIPISYKDRSIGYIRMEESSEAVKAFNIYDFLGSIFNIYVFLFLVASVLAIFIAKSITKPLSLLNQKLTAIKLGKRNERISWEREDEVGELITNYNNMVQQLEDSAEILAKTERDNAWREMAKQVAHEIKNPLTPMKMYIQHLEKAVKQSPDRAIEISKKISQTLLEQVENLTQIADSFSNFAELPQSSNEKIEINKVVALVHNLFRKRDDMEIVLSEPIDPLYVYADKNQLIRILNNLVKNAIESIPKDRKGRVSLSLVSKEDKAIICVEDNGSGVPPEMSDKIFQPKFTTKDSGSGLGLAIALNMIESMNGRLYFKSNPGSGTRFFIELDLIRQNFDDSEKRITLD